MLERILIAGSGGQGILLAGKLLATVAVKSVPHVTFFPSYGAEVRGGTSNCQVILSSGEIHSPVSEEFDAMMIMNRESAEKFLPQKAKNGLVILNISMCGKPDDASAVLVSATDTANQIGDTRVANFIMLGAFLARKQVVRPEDVEETTREILAGKNTALVDLDIKALRTGLKL